MYTFPGCQFVYRRSDKYGNLFNHHKERDIQFYIKRKDSITPNKSSNLTIKMLTSYLSDDVDYATELSNIISNSTLSSDFPINNAITEGLDYWASNITQGRECKPVNIEITLKVSTVIKSVIIEWVKPPFSVLLSFCDANNYCRELNPSSDFSELRSRFPDIYLKSKLIRIVMDFNPNSNDYNYQCSCSITYIEITKNQIMLKPLSLKESKKDLEETSVLNNINLFTDNFLITKIEDLKKGDITSLLKMFDTSIKDIKRIIKNKNEIERDYFSMNSNFTRQVEDLAVLNKEYNENLDEKFDLFFGLEDIVKDEYINPDDYEKGKTSTEGPEEKNKISDYTDALHNFLSLKNYILNLKEYKHNLTNFYNLNFDEISKLKLSFYAYLNDEAIHFSESYSDQHVRDTVYTISKLKEIKKVFKIYDKLVPFYKNLDTVDSSMDSMKQLTTQEMSDRFTYLYKCFDDAFAKKKLEQLSLMNSFQVYLQTLKLIKPKFKEIYLNIDNICTPVNLITNSSFDNLFIKLFITFSRINVNEFNYFIFKLYSNEFFYYLKYNSYKIEIVKKKYEEEVKLFEYNKLHTDYDRFSQTEDFSKLFYILIKVNEGNIKVLLKVDYNKPPVEIVKYLNSFNNIDYDKLLSLSMQNENDFDKYYADTKLIYEALDQDLKLTGLMGVNSPRNTTNIIIAAAYPQLNKKTTKIASTLNTKYPFGYFPSVKMFKKIKINQTISNLLYLDSYWFAYDSEFSVLSNFYFKFEVNTKKIFGEDFVINSKINNLNSAFLQMTSLRSPFNYFFEIMSISDGFIFKVFMTNIEKNTKSNIFRRSFKGKGSFTFVFIKINESMQIRIKKKSKLLYRTIFTFKNLNFINFLYVLNPQNVEAITSIYFSNTFGGGFIAKEKTKSNPLMKCTKDRFDSYKCAFDDQSLCKKLFCKSCCSKRLRTENIYQYQQCFEECVKINFNILN